MRRRERWTVRGFGVVADAVRDLAAKVEQSSKLITGTVNRLATSP